jgi:hypothetical protein
LGTDRVTSSNPVVPLFRLSGAIPRDAYFQSAASNPKGIDIVKTSITALLYVLLLLAPASPTLRGSTQDLPLRSADTDSIAMIGSGLIFVSLIASSTRKRRRLKG